jgi:hypothetical protein
MHGEGYLDLPEQVSIRLIWPSRTVEPRYRACHLNVGRIKQGTWGSLHRRAQKFPEATSFKIDRSSAWFATIRLRRSFSGSRVLRRLA